MIRTYSLLEGTVPRKPSRQPNDVELDILRVVWKLKRCTVREVHEVLQATRQSGYTTTLKMMQVMCEKGLLKRDDTQRPQIYSPAVPEEQTQRQIVGELIRKVFGGSTRKLVMHAVQSDEISQDEISEIRKLLDQLEGRK